MGTLPLVPSTSKSREPVFRLRLPAPKVLTASSAKQAVLSSSSVLPFILGTSRGREPVFRLRQAAPKVLTASTGRQVSMKPAPAMARVGSSNIFPEPGINPIVLPDRVNGASRAFGAALFKSLPERVGMAVRLTNEPEINVVQSTIKATVKLTQGVTLQ